MMNENHEKLSREEQKAAKAAALEECVTNLENGSYEVYHFVGQSDAWEKFVKIRECNTKNHVDYAQCIECKGLLSFKEGSGTSHLSRHVCRQGRAGEDDNSKFRCLPMEKYGATKKYVTNNIIKYCVSAFVPPETICDSTDFIDCSQSFVLLGYKAGHIDVKNVFPSSKHVNTDIFDFKEEKMRELYQTFREALKNKWCSLTIEIKTFGSLKNRNDNKVAVISVQYFAKDLTKLKKKFILCTMLNGEQSMETFPTQLIKEFNIFGGDKEDLDLLDFVTPNEEIFSASNFPHARRNCYVNIITKILDEAFQSSETLRNCRDIICYINSTEKYNMKLSEDDGNWNSKLDMIKSIHMNYEGLNKIFENEKKDLNFSKRKAEDIMSYLELFIEAIKDLSSTSHTTANKVLLWWTILKEHLHKNEKLCFELKGINAIAQENFELKFRPNMHNKIDTFLDPRYKSLTMISDSERASVLDQVRTLLENFDDNNDRVDVAPPAAKKGRFAQFEGCKVNKEKNKRKNKEDPKAQNRFARFETINRNTNDDDEVNVYLKLPEMGSEDFETEFGIINQFWKQKQKLLPKLFKLATTRLHVPACCGSVSLDKITSKEDLTQAMINDYLFVRDNLDQLTC